MLNPKEISSLRYVGEISHEKVNEGQPIPLFEPVAPAGKNSINTREVWNTLAERQDRRAFEQCFGREPVCNEELKAWEQKGFPRVKTIN